MCHYSSISYLFLYILCITCRQTVAWWEISETGRLSLCGDECWILCVRLVFMSSTFVVQGFSGTMQEERSYRRTTVSFQTWWKMNIVRCLLFLDKSKSVQSANFLDLYVFFFQEVAASAQAEQSFRFERRSWLKDSDPDSQKPVEKK